MIAKASSTYRPASPPRGLTLVEMVMSMVLVGVGVVGALNAVGASKLAQFKVNVSRTGHLLAQDLMTEILLQDYADRVDGLDSFGLSAAETATGDRSLFDDVDDYDGWSATPPQHQDGTDFVGLDGWERSVAVAWVSPADPSQLVGGNQGVKRITVTVTHNGVPAAELAALKTIGLPPLEACCFEDGSCDDLRVEACAAEGGTSMGPDTICSTTECPTGSVVLFVSGGNSVEGPFGDPLFVPTAEEGDRIELIQSWGYQVTLIPASAWQSEFDEAVAAADVVYVSEEIDSATLSTKLRDAAIGIVNEEIELQEEFGIGTVEFNLPRDEIKIIDNTHYITSELALGYIPILSSMQPVNKLNGETAPGLDVLAEVWDTGGENNNKPTLAVLNVGGELYGGGTAAGRRVQLPWGTGTFDFNALNAVGKSIMQRSIEWAAATSVPLLLVVTDDTNPTAQELARQVLIASWGYNVTMISASAPQADLDAAVANADVAYVPVEVDPGQLAAKLKDAPIGVVNEEPQAGFGFARIIRYVATSTVRVDDNTHYITSLFDSGPLLLFDPSQPVSWLSSPLSPDMRILGSTPDGASYEPSLAILEAGDTLWNGGTAAGRRVRLPWADDAFDFNALNADGRMLMKRAIEWAAEGSGGGGGEPVCGDATCDPGEECTCPADCGDPAAFEEPGVTCDDGLDNDCDDINCFGDPACLVCGNGTCELGEDCNSCLVDCPGVTTGNPSNRYCCGNGVAEGPEGDGSICDGNY